jgi:hypothetical protein
LRAAICFLMRVLAGPLPNALPTSFNVRWQLRHDHPEWAKRIAINAHEMRPR